MPTQYRQYTAPTARRRWPEILLSLPAIAATVQAAAAAPATRELVTVYSVARQPVTFNVRRSRTTGLTTFVTPVAADPLVIPTATGEPADPITFFVEFGALFGITAPHRNLVQNHRWTDNLGRIHTQYQQTFSGLPVFSGTLRLHQDAEGRILAANGRFYPIKEPVNPQPKLTGEEAAAVASQLTTSANASVEYIKLVIVDPGWYGDPSAGVHLAYEMVLADPSAGVREAFFVDAHTGEVLDRWDVLHTAIDRRIYTEDGSGTLPGMLRRSEGDPPVPQLEEVNAAYDYFGDLYGYFARAFGRDSLDDAGIPLVATVDTRAIRCPNAFWSDDLLQAAFCKLTVADDIVAHELTHGITDFSANLVYQNQPGQLNESFSDVFGELVDLYNGGAQWPGPPQDTPWPDHPTGPGVDDPNNRRTTCSSRQDDHQDGVRWLIGEDARAFATALRDMWDPTCKRHPDRANSPFQTCDPRDNGGVHTGSSVPNHAFAIVTDGKTFNGYTVRGIGPIKAGAVWYRALTTYLTRASDFQDAFDAINQAAADLVGTYPKDPRTGLPSDDVFTNDDAAQVESALRAVEMDTPGFCGQSVAVLSSEPPPTCPTHSVIYRNDFDADVGDWLVSNTGPPTPYDWMLTEEPLPFGRPGRAWFCDDPNIGDCDGIPTEDAVHSLYSPWIRLSETTRVPYASWTHYMASEIGWDGGNVRIRVNGGAWELVPSTAFAFNPYNSRIYGQYFEDNNPLAGQEGWTGIGGEWGTSLVDLSGYVGPGDYVQLRFDFGKDRCGGLEGWFIDDFEIFSCNDCDRDGISDLAEFTFTKTSPPIRPFGQGQPQHITLTAVSPAAAAVHLSFAAIGDLQEPEEFIDVDVDGVLIGRIFELSGQDCPITPRIDELWIPMADFNVAAADGSVTINLTSSTLVDPELCGGRSFIKVFVEYEVDADDDDGNHVIDVCEGCAVAPAPSIDPTLHPAGRYVSIIPPISPGRLTALRVVPVDVPESLGFIAGEARWVGQPRALTSAVSGSQSVAVAPTGCVPAFVDWSAFDLVHTSGAAIVPGATYRVEAIDVACIDDPAVDARFSEPRSIATARWGDVRGGSAGGGPDGQVDMSDIAAIIDAFKRIATAPPLTSADLAPAVPDQLVSFLDIGQAVRAFKNEPYPFVDIPPCN